jgi:hypothetical protein
VARPKLLSMTTIVDTELFAIVVALLRTRREVARLVASILLNSSAHPENLEESKYRRLNHIETRPNLSG